MIIPTLNEGATIAHLLQDLTESGVCHEIIVVDGGSTDDTLSIAARFGIRTIRSTRGRAHQMNAGAARSTGDILWFVHADSRISQEAMVNLLDAANGGVMAGCFYLKFDRQGFWYSFFSRVSRLNWSVFTYGDQGIFVNKQLFNSMEGYKPIPIMEDLDLVIRIKKKAQFVKFQLPIVTSSRRFEANGVVWQELKNVVLVLLYLIGISPFFLKRYY